MCFSVTAVFPALEELGNADTGRKGQGAARSPAAQGKLHPPSECSPAFKRVVCGECGTAVAARPSLSSTWRLFAITGLRRKAYNS